MRAKQLKLTNRYTLIYICLLFTQVIVNILTIGNFDFLLIACGLNAVIGCLSILLGLIRESYILKQLLTNDTK